MVLILNPEPTDFWTLRDSHEFIHTLDNVFHIDGFVHESEHYSRASIANSLSISKLLNIKFCFTIRCL